MNSNIISKGLEYASKMHVSNTKKYYTRQEIESSKENIDKEAYLKVQDRLIKKLDSSLKDYKNFLKNDPARRQGKKRLEKVKSMKDIFDDISLYPPKEMLADLPLFDLEIEKLEYEIEVSEIIQMVRTLGTSELQAGARDKLRGTPLDFLVHASESVDEMHHEFVRGFVVTLMEDGRDMKSFLSAMKEDPSLLIDSIVAPLKLLWELDWEDIKALPVILKAADSFFDKMKNSDGEYAPFVAGKIAATLCTMLVFKQFSGLQKLHRFLKHADKAASATKLNSKLLLQMGDNYSLLTDQKYYNLLLKELYYRFPENDMIMTRAAVEKMIRKVLTLPPERQAKAMNALMRFVASGKAEDIKTSEDLEKWFKAWVQKTKIDSNLKKEIDEWDETFEEFRVKNKSEIEEIDDLTKKITLDLNEFKNEVDEVLVVPIIKKDSSEEVLVEVSREEIENPNLEIIRNYFEYREDDPLPRYGKESMTIFENDLRRMLGEKTKEFHKYIFDNRETFRDLILEVTPFGWEVSFEHFKEDIRDELESKIGLGELFADHELKTHFEVVYPKFYKGKHSLEAIERKGRKYLNKDGEYVAIFTGCDIII